MSAWAGEALPVREASVAAWLRCYAGLSAPALEASAGVWEARLIGPDWLRLPTPALLRLLGLPGWHGKAFDGAGLGLNRLRRGGREERVMPMRVAEGASAIDGRAALWCVYPANARWPWRHVHDELRSLEEGRLLGMMCCALPRLPHFVAPFMLERTGNAHG